MPHRKHFTFLSLLLLCCLLISAREAKALTISCTEAAFDSALAQNADPKIVISCPANTPLILTGEKTIPAFITTIQSFTDDLVQIQGNNTFRLFNIQDQNVKLLLQGLDLSGGNAGTLNGGGAIANSGSLTLTKVKIHNNTAGGGAGIFNRQSGILNISFSEIFQNNTLPNPVPARSRGGALLNDRGQVVINSSSLFNNNALFGAGIHNITAPSASLAIVNSTLFQNGDMAPGSGLFNTTGTDLAQNTAFPGVIIRSSTFVDNFGDPSHGLNIHNESDPAFQQPPQIRIKNSLLVINTLIANGGATQNCTSSKAGTFLNEGFNLQYNVNNTPDSSCLPMSTPTQPLLGDFSFHGGSTRNISLLSSPANPAIDQGDPAGCKDQLDVLLPFDQRGSLFDRILDGNLDGAARCDIGAFELPMCGDGVLNQAGVEDCDLNAPNDCGDNETCGNPQDPVHACKCVPPPSTPTCGDGVKNQPSEECDNGVANGTSNCDSSCHIACGNKVLNLNEMCDPSAPNGNVCEPGNYCKPHDLANPNDVSQCHCVEIPSVCGDGACGIGEDCSNCQADCNICPTNPGCGNHIKEPGEACDDGNQIDSDGCTNKCEIGSNPVINPGAPLFLEGSGLHCGLSTQSFPINPLLSILTLMSTVIIVAWRKRTS